MLSFLFKKKTHSFLPSFPILGQVGISEVGWETEQKLLSYRNDRIKEIVKAAIEVFEPRLSSEMINFHIEECIRSERIPEVIHIYYQNEKPKQKSWEELAPRTQTQLRLIRKLVTKLKVV